MNKYNLPLHVDQIDCIGRTREEKRLNKELLETLLELNSYQDNYENMRTVDEIKERLENRKQLIREDYIPIEDYNRYLGEIKAMEWILDGSYNVNEKVKPFKTSDDVVELLEFLGNKYKQISIYDCGVEDEKENKDN